MICGTLLVAGGLIALQRPSGNRVVVAAAPTGAAERVTLRDGSSVLGLVLSESKGARGAVEMIVRRDWAEQHVKTWADKWNRVITSGARLAARQRSQRLLAWRRDRAQRMPAGDRIIAWIDQERKRLDDPAQSARTPLMPVHISRSDVRSLARQSRANQRLLQLGWLCGLPDVESMSLGDLKDAVESRGFLAQGDQTPSLAKLLPLVPESELAWLGHRAATELAVDTDLKFIRYQGMILPDISAAQLQAQGLGGLNLASALGEINRLLDPQQNQQDPLVARLKQIGDSGRVGALVTRLDLPADLAHTSVEATLWVRTAPLRWIPFLTRSVAVRPEDLTAGEGQNLAADPRVKTAFSIVESLGLGTIPPEVKERTLRMGVATDKALGGARAAINHDLNLLALPVLDQSAEAPAQAGQAGKPPAPGSDR
ncbi:MAG: hypothetical protein ACP5XB_26390 [Isosphaeraceae bacterium]